MITIITILRINHDMNIQFILLLLAKNIVVITTMVLSLPPYNIIKLIRSKWQIYI